ncbi:MAG: DUF975 family protein [Ruminococcus sp.]|jgi:uncharacterized membrane protein
MKRSSKEFKEIAREALMGSYGTFAFTYLIYFLIAFIIELIPMLLIQNESPSGLIVLQIVMFILSLIVSVLASGFQKIALNISRGEYAGAGDLFYCFRHHPDRFIIVTLLLSLIYFVFQIPTIALGVWVAFTNNAYHTPLSSVLMILLVALIMVIISFFVALRFSLAVILLIDNPDMGAIESMKTSSHLMKGNIGRYFYLTVSFIGMMMLSLLSFGIGTIWVTPYMNMTYIEFYREVIGELDGGPRENNYTKEYSYQEF